MPISAMRLKSLMPHGGVREVAREVGVAESYVSGVLTGKKRPKTAVARETVHRIQAAIARRIGKERDEVFPLTSTPGSTRTEATPSLAPASVRVPRARAGSPR